MIEIKIGEIMEITEGWLEQLKQGLSMLNDKEHTASNQLRHNEWVLRGKPFVWSIVDQQKGATLLSDSAYGYVALFVDETLVGTSQSLVTSPDEKFIGFSESYLKNRLQSGKWYNPHLPSLGYDVSDSSIESLGGKSS